MKKTVFVIAFRHADQRIAERWGSLRFLCEIAFPKFKIHEMHEHFHAILTEESSPEDYLLLSGLSVMNSIATGILSHLHGRVNFLIHSTRIQDYVPVTVEFRK